MNKLKSNKFSVGNKNFLIPAFIPPNIFKSNPPIIVTFPCKLISPVIAKSFLIFLSFNKL